MCAARSWSFNPRSRTGSDCIGTWLVSRTAQLQSTLPHGERPASRKRFISSRVLQSTLPHGERPSPTKKYLRGLSLQSTLPHGERHRSAMPLRACKRLQSTLPHGERPMAQQEQARQQLASIHAPARGATNSGSQYHLRSQASIHAPARGATGATNSNRKAELLQSTLPHGERPGRFSPLRFQISASIHAPARGATAGLKGHCLGDVASIHAPARGATRLAQPLQSPLKRLQSTLPHGERPGFPVAAPERPAASIHAPARGATRGNGR